MIQEQFIDKILPKWIKSINVDTLFKDYIQSGSGTHHILNSSQFRYIEEDITQYTAIGRTLADIEDVEYYSNLTFTFDPTYEELSLHTIKVLRDGVWIDKLSDAKVDILQREEDLKKLIYDGRQTLSLILYDIRTDDLLYFDYSRKGVNPIFKPYLGQIRYINNTTDIYYSHIFALFDQQSHQNLEIRYFNQDTPMVKNEFEDQISYELISRNLAALTIPNDVPKWYDPWSRIVFSNTQSWEEVNAWARSIYHNGIYHADEQMNLLIEECRQHSENKAEQALYALSYVQEQIRYFADGSNLGGIVPIDPNKSLNMRFADCKNKVVILKTILNELNIESYPVLVHSSDGMLLPEHGPNVAAFNHMIIQIILDGKTYWFDATYTDQAGDINHFTQINYHYALVLKEGEKELQSMNSIEEHGSITVKQTFDLRDEENYLITLVTYTGSEADNIRNRSRGRKIRQLETHYVEYMQKTYPNLQLAKPLEIVKDDKQKNQITLKEEYNLGSIWEKEKGEEDLQAYFQCDELRKGIYFPGKGQRNAPLFIKKENITEIRKILLPYTYEDEITTKTEDNPFFSYIKEEQYDEAENSLHQTYTYKTKQTLIEANQVPEYNKALDNIFTNYRLWHNDPYDKSGYRVQQALPPEKQTIYIHAKQYYDLREKESKLTVKTDYYGHEAFTIRQKIKASKLEDLQKEYTDYYALRYQDVNLLEPFEVNDDPVQNKITLIEKYSLGEAWTYDKDSKGYAIIFYNDILNGAYRIPDNRNEKEPFILKYPSYIVEEREIAFPTPYETFLSNKIENNEFFSYQKKEKMDKETNTLIQKYTYQTKAKNIMADSLEQYNKEVDKIENFHVAWKKLDPYDNSLKNKIKQRLFEALFIVPIYFIIKELVNLVWS
ncbi:DUF3857 domain-containing protein [Sulfurovum sp. zt1-1]|uniref:DUF3857 domain-containing protein n=1 Tax=Sulfurovum zhangzhouensis TaxID=3019067 RepID=A0ABT7QYB0_9BACT|nr:DUF3857 domain-containing protein [Sulfurovum zhangzhouensis]MDM5271756.1 DUF3857 domain-containing protein [Sulfurovum zhangzhouensis]